jgi:hypothetical protein
MLQPVASSSGKKGRAKDEAHEAEPAPAKTRSRKKKQTPEPEVHAGPSFALPTVHVQNWRTYTLAGIIAMLGFAAAWQGVNIVLVVLALAGGLALALAPTVTKRIGELSFDMPDMPSVSMPSVAMPQVKAPRINLGEIPAIRELATKDDPGIDADTLRTSTASTIARWRQSVGLQVLPGQPIAEHEELELEHEQEAVATEDTAPLDAVMNILRNGAQRTPTR